MKNDAVVSYIHMQQRLNHEKLQFFCVYIQPQTIQTRRPIVELKTQLQNDTNQLMIITWKLIY